jgi:hypothetical protein
MASLEQYDTRWNRLANQAQFAPSPRANRTQNCVNGRFG